MKKMTFALAAVACLALFLSGCGSSPKDMIIGKWEAGQAPAKITAEFGKDGKVKINMMGIGGEGTYKINGSDELEWSMGGKTSKFKMKLTATELNITGEDGKTVTYKKV